MEDLRLYNSKPTSKTPLSSSSIRRKKKLSYDIIFLSELPPLIPQEDGTEEETIVEIMEGNGGT